jgi:hypothetical protein
MSFYIALVPRSSCSCALGYLSIPTNVSWGYLSIAANVSWGMLYVFRAMSAVRIFPFRSIIPKRLKIFGWYLVWGCIRRERCVAQKICVDAKFDLDPVTLKPKFPSALYLLNEWKIFGCYLVGGCIRVYIMCQAKDLCRCDLWPWPQIA